MSRLMRLMVFFDLPTTTVRDKKNYVAFRKYLLGDGYDMLQYSVYCRIARNRDDAAKYIARLKGRLPPEGQVRALLVTEKQYAQMMILLGKPTAVEEHLKDKELIVL